MARKTGYGFSGKENITYWSLDRPRTANPPGSLTATKTAEPGRRLVLDSILMLGDNLFSAIDVFSSSSLSGSHELRYAGGAGNTELVGGNLCSSRVGESLEFILTVTAAFTGSMQLAGRSIKE